MDWLELLLPIVKDLIIIFVIAVIVPAIGAGVKWWKDLTIENWIKELVVDGVLFVQEKFWEYSGEEKFEFAKQWVIERLNEKGIDVSMEWLEGLIDAVVKQLRAEFGDESWYREEE
jgi:hypothetical protein